MAQGIKIEEERIKAIKSWLELKSVRDIQMFLGFTNVYKRFIRNFNIIVASLPSMLQITNESTGNESRNTEAENQNAPDAAGEADNGKVGGSIKNLLTIANSTKNQN